MINNRFKRLIGLIVLVLFPFIQVHVTMHTVGNVLNPITLIYLFYYSPPYNGEGCIWLPCVFIFTFQSVISLLLIKFWGYQLKWKSCVISYFLCLIILIIFVYLVEYRWTFINHAIDKMIIADKYYKIYNYGQAFRLILGYTVLQYVFLLLYIIVGMVNHDSSNHNGHGDMH